MEWASTLEVTSAATSYDLISLADFKGDHGITSNTQDALLGRLIKRASFAISRACNRVFVQETVKETLWGRIGPASPLIMGQGELMLSRCPVIEIVSVSEAGTELAADEYTVNRDCGILLRFCSGVPVLWKSRNIEVVYKAGFAEIPEDLQDATSMVVWDRLQSINQDRTVQSRFVDGVDRVEYFKPTQEAFPPEVQGILDTYRATVLR